MESLALDHVVMEQKDSYSLLCAVAEEIKLEDINAMCRSYLSFATNYGQEAEVGFYPLPCLLAHTQTIDLLISSHNLFSLHVILLLNWFAAVCLLLIQLLEQAKSNPSDFFEVGPTRATAIIACVPSFMDVTGQSTGGGAPMQRGMSMVTGDHVDVDSIPDLDELTEEFKIPEVQAPFQKFFIFLSPLGAGLLALQFSADLLSSVSFDK